VSQPRIVRKALSSSKPPCSTSGLLGWNSLIITDMTGFMNEGLRGACPRKALPNGLAFHLRGTDRA
jgi:hypothetical protein